MEARVTFAEARADSKDHDQVVTVVHAQIPDVKLAQVHLLVYGADTHTLVMWEGSEIRGVATYRVHDSMDLVDVQFFATTTHRCGFGRCLMAELKRLCHEKYGVHFVSLYTAKNAVGFFQLMGFGPESDLPAEVLKPRVEVFSNASMLVCDLTKDGFESAASRHMQSNTRVGDQVLVRHGLRFPVWREAWVVALEGSKAQVLYAKSKDEREWIPLGSKRLLSEAGDVEVAAEPEPKPKAKAKAKPGPRVARAVKPKPALAKPRTKGLSSLGKRAAR